MKKLLLGSALLVVACSNTTNVHMQLAESFVSGSESIPVKRSMWMQSKEPMTIGGYEVVAFHDAKKTHVRSDDITPPYVPSDVSGGVRQVESRTKQSVRFDLKEGGADRWHADCETQANGEGVKAERIGLDVPLRDKADTVCTLDGADGARWTLNLWRYSHGVSPLSIKGELTDGTTTYDVMPVYRFTSTRDSSRSFELPAPLGFTLTSGDTVVTAVDQIASTHGTMMLAANADPRQKSLFAATWAAVLLQLEERGGGTTIGR